MHTGTEDSRGTPLLYLKLGNRWKRLANTTHDHLNPERQTAQFSIYFCCVHL